MNLNGTFAIYKKELKTNVFSFSFLMLAAIFSLLIGFFFVANVHDYTLMLEQIPDQELIPVDFHQGVLLPFLMNALLLLLIVTPILTVRAFWEEKKLGVFELLFTYPISDFQIVLGKWFLLMTQLLILAVPILVSFLILTGLGKIISISTIILVLAAFMVIGLAIFAMGMSVSSFSNHFLSGIGFTFLLLAVFWSFGWLADFFLPALSPVLKNFWVMEHIREIAAGILDFRRFLFYALSTVFFFLISIWSLESRAWRR